MNQPRNTPVETPVENAADEACPTRPLIDIRSPRERDLGIPGGAIHSSVEEVFELCRKGNADEIPGGFIICAEGIRSKALVLKLKALGFENFTSVSGGFQSWAAAGLPVAYPEGLNAGQTERYARHLVMPQVGLKGQRKLLQSKILLAGLGGLNSPVALYLAAAGVGTLGLADFDCVERSNLQRQIIHGESKVGESKASSARDRIRELNSDTETVVYPQRISPANADKVLEPWDIVVDGTDSFSSRYALNDACVRVSKPLVYGAVMRFQGQVSVFWPAAPEPQSTPCFRCMMPQEPDNGEAPGCAEAGVLGVMPGIVGTLQANEAIKLALQIGQPLLGKLLMIDALNMEFRKMNVPANPQCPACGLNAP